MSIEPSVHAEPPEVSHNLEAYDDTRREAIAARAYEISLSDEAGSDLDNWVRAERELSSDTGADG
jgi:hypothetical protein